MERLQDSYLRLNAIQKLKGRVSYFQDFRKELRLDVRNIRLQQPKADEYRTAFQEDDPDDDEEEFIATV